MNQIKVKWQKHFKWFGKAMLISSIIVWLLPLFVSNTFQMLAPPSAYFVYEKWNKVSLVEWNEVWKNPIFESSSQFKRDIRMTWYDTLYCNDIKFPTQVWTDFMEKEYFMSRSQWKYYSYVFEEKDRNSICKMCWIIVWTTSYWYNKSLNYCTDNFLIK